MDGSQLEQLKGELKDLIASNKIEQAIERFKTIIPSSSIRYNILVKFQQEYASISESKWKDIYSSTDLNLKHSKLVDNLLEFVDIIEPGDLLQSSKSSRRRHKTGSVLYSIPSQMEIGKEQKCVIRLAFDEEMLREYFSIDSDTRIETLRRIEEQMEVELVDPNEKDVFAIRTINSKRQIVEQDDYTEWLYYVKPHMEGVFELYLKVTVIITDKGKKEIVLHEKVEVTTHPAKEAEPAMAYKDSGLLFTIALPAIAPIGQQAPAEPTASATTAASSKGILGTVGAKVAAAVGGAAIVAGALFLGTGNGSETTPLVQETQQVEAKALFAKQEIEAPIPEINNFSESFEVDPTQDTTILTESGTKIHIPANSIVDKNGALVVEKIEIRIKEIRTAHEIIASGIPMRYYDENGEESWMQTAGMFEIDGYLKGEKVEIAPNKMISVDFTTEIKDACDFWFFDKETGNWQNKATNTTAIDNPEIARIDEEIKKMAPPPRPIQPVIGDPQKILPPFKIDYRYFPELKEFRELEWEYTGSVEDNPRNDPSFFEGWKDIIIKKGAGGTYVLTFNRDHQSLDVPVRPCFRRAKDLEAFNKSMSSYNEKRKVYDAYVKREQERKAFRERQSSFIRQMGIQEFGIYNWDYLIKREKALPVYADFDFEDQLREDLENEVIVYLITGDGRTVISFPKRSWRDFSFLPDLDNKLVAVLPGGRIALFSQEQFDAEMKNLREARFKTYEFEMKVLPEQVDNIKDLEQIIG